MPAPLDVALVEVADDDLLPRGDPRRGVDDQLVASGPRKVRGTTPGNSRRTYIGTISKLNYTISKLSYYYAQYQRSLINHCSFFSFEIVIPCLSDNFRFIFSH